MKSAKVVMCPEQFSQILSLEQWMQSEGDLMDKYFVQIILFKVNLELEIIGQKDITLKV